MPGIVKKKQKTGIVKKKKIKNNTKLFITNLEKIHG